ncbi:hypothetical protein pb186bvf_012729 [Paramecium bursaria]
MIMEFNKYQIQLNKKTQIKSITSTEWQIQENILKQQCIESIEYHVFKFSQFGNFIDNLAIFNEQICQKTYFNTFPLLVNRIDHQVQPLKQNDAELQACKQQIVEYMKIKEEFKNKMVNVKQKSIQIRIQYYNGDLFIENQQSKLNYWSNKLQLFFHNTNNHQKEAFPCF